MRLVSLRSSEHRGVATDFLTLNAFWVNFWTWDATNETTTHRENLIMATRCINKVILIGNLGKDPELRYTSSGVAVASFTLATNETWKDPEGNVQERTQWHNIVAWRKLAEICGEYLKKGSKIYLEGKLQYRNYDDKSGVKRYVTEIVIDEMLMLDAKGGAQTASETSSQRDETPSGPASDLPF